MKLRNIVAVVAFAVSAASLPAAAESCFSLDIAPPDALDDSMPPSPGLGYIWSPGYWDCQNAAHEWRPGGWIHDRPGYSWEPHHWERDANNHYQLHQGQWHEGGGHAAGGHEGGGHGR
jgi:hypothetical protein